MINETEVLGNNIKIDISEFFDYNWDILRYAGNQKSFAKLRDKKGNELLLTTHGETVIKYDKARLFNYDILLHENLYKSIMCGTARD